MKIKVSHEFHGYVDYWGGNGRRWDNDAGCLFAFYGRETTLRDCVDQWVDDFCMGGDCDSFPADIGADELREAIVADLLNDRGRADYNSGALCEFAADCEDNRECRECGASIGCEHEEDCAIIDEILDGDDQLTIDDIENEVTEDDCTDCDDCDDWDESPIWVILVELEEDDD